MSVRREHVRHSRKITRGERWRVLRMATLERDGFRCRACGAGGRLEVDHVQPVRSHPDLAHDPANLQALCPSCHTRKTRLECGHPPPSEERQGWAAAVSQLERPGAAPRRFSIPPGLKASAIPVTIVCGPPAAGKSTYIAAEAAPGDRIIDFDTFMTAAGGRKWDTDRALVREAFRLRNEALAALASARSGRAWFIVGAPSAAERSAWRVALRRASVVVLATDPDTCKARVWAAPDRQHAIGLMCAAIEKWWATYAADRGVFAEEARCLTA